MEAVGFTTGLDNRDANNTFSGTNECPPRNHIVKEININITTVSMAHELLLKIVLRAKNIDFQL
jgi:hypothetical protein